MRRDRGSHAFTFIIDSGLAVCLQSSGHREEWSNARKRSQILHSSAALVARVSYCPSFGAEPTSARRETDILLHPLLVGYTRTARGLQHNKSTMNHMTLLASWSDDAGLVLHLLLPLPNHEPPGCPAGSEKSRSLQGVWYCLVQTLGSKGRTDRI